MELEKENEVNVSIPAGRIYAERSVWAGTFLGGPLVGGYLIAENFKAFNESEKVKQTWIAAIIVTIVVFVVVFSLPEKVKPGQLIPLLYTGLAYFFVQYAQGKNIKSHIESGGSTYKWYRVFWIGIIGGLLTALPVLVVYDGVELIKGSQASSKTFGKLKHQIDYDKGNISDAEIDKIGKGLEEVSFFDRNIKKYTYVTKEDSAYLISVSFDRLAAENPGVISEFELMRDEMQKLIPDKRIRINLVSGSVDSILKRIE